MDEWNIALWVIAGYIAVMTLARAMHAKRQHLVEQFRRWMEKEKQRKAEQERRKGMRLRKAEDIPTAPSE